MGERIVVLGGTRSGKSAVAESLVSGWPVCYVATGTAVDGEMAARIADHRARRPAGWLTLETTELSAALTAPSDHALLIDSLGGWVTAALWPRGPEASEGTGAGQLEALAAFWEAAGERASPTVVVAEDAGSGLVATDPGTRSWVDLLGEAAQTLAATADRVILVVAGRPVDLPPAPTLRDPSSPTPRLEGAAAEGRDGVEVVGEAWLREHGDRQGWAGALDLAVNVKAGGVPQHVAAALAGADVTRYPDDREAREAVARRWGRRVEEVGVTAGASEAFWLLPRVLPARLAAVVHPAFTEPEAALRAAGVPVVRVLRHEADGWRLDPSAVPDEADLVVVGNPNNPTGTLDEPATVASLARPGRTLVVDEAFMDYVADDGCSLAGRDDVPGLVVVRTVTKLWGIPGVRAGYVLADAATVAGLAACRQPWSVGAHAIAAIVACLADPDWARAEAARAGLDREDAAARLASLPTVTVVPSAGPFLLLRVPDGPAVRAALADRGIAVRAPTFPGLTPDHLRVAVRDRDATDRLVAALRAALHGP